MTRTEIDNLNRLPIVDVARRLGMEVDAHHRTLCPFHDDHNPSLSFSVSRNTFRCFSCGAYGDVISLAKKVLNKGFAETILWLRGERDGSGFRGVYDANGNRPTRTQIFDASKYVRFFEHPFLNKRASKFLFEERKLHPSVIEWLRLSSYRDNLQIPYFGLDGRLIGVQFRNLGSSGPRFWFPSCSQCHIYNLPILNYLSPGEDLYIAEGCSDCWSLMSAGHKAIAIPSATLLRTSDLQLLSTLISQLSTEFHMYPDNDQPGQQLYQQLCKNLPVIRHQLPSGCKDYSDAYVKLLNC